jgi:hypothetical protein
MVVIFPAACYLQSAIEGQLLFIIMPNGTVTDGIGNVSGTRWCKWRRCNAYLQGANWVITSGLDYNLRANKLLQFVLKTQKAWYFGITPFFMSCGFAHPNFLFFAPSHPSPAGKGIYL